VSNLRAGFGPDLLAVDPEVQADEVHADKDAADPRFTTDRTQS
jgi:hypothetical protein